jgi:tetratricopeptide (TPR) repeat protein
MEGTQTNQPVNLSNGSRLTQHTGLEILKRTGLANLYLRLCARFEHSSYNLFDDTLQSHLSDYTRTRIKFPICPLHKMAIRFNKVNWLQTKASRRVDKQQSPRSVRKPRRRPHWGSKDAYLGLPRYDCQSPIEKHKKIKGLDCEIHAKILRQRLQDLLVTWKGHNIHTEVKESPFRHSLIKSARPQQPSTETNPQPSPSTACNSDIRYDNSLNECLKAAELDPQNIKILYQLASIYTGLGRSQDATNIYARIESVLRPPRAMPCLQRPVPIRKEVPHINPNFTATLAKLGSTTTSGPANGNQIPLFDLASLLNTTTQAMRFTISSNAGFTGYTSLVGIRVQQPSYASLR